MVEMTKLLTNPDEHLDDLQREWLAPSSKLRIFLHWLLCHFNRMVVKTVYNLRVDGLEKVPNVGPVIFAPNHESSLDAPLVAAALSCSTLRYTRWAGRQGVLLRNPLVRFINWVAQTVPVRRNHTALAVGAAVLENGDNLVWFPEGTRSKDGQLDEFRLGVGLLAIQRDLPVVPIRIEGAFEAWPPHRTFPHFFKTLHVRICDPVLPAEFRPFAKDENELCEMIRDAIRDRIKSAFGELEKSVT